MIGLYAGSFDPLHLGHLDIIEAAACRCSHLWVATAVNASKVSGLLSLEDRRNLLTESVRHLENVSVTICDGLLVTLARELGADMLIRGAARGGSCEMQMAVTNLAVGDIPLVLLSCTPDHGHISSTYVRLLLVEGGPEAIKELVPRPVFEWALRRLEQPTSRPQ